MSSNEQVWRNGSQGGGISRRSFLRSSGRAALATAALGLGPSVLLDACGSTRAKGGGPSTAPTASGNSVASASGSSAPATPASGTVMWWEDLAGSKANARTALVNAFQKANPKVNVQQTTIFSPTDDNQKVLTAMASGTAPDLISNTWVYSIRYAAANQLLPLNDYLTKSGMSPNDFNKAALGTGTYNGAIYSIPLFVSSRMLFWNGDVAKSANVDVTKPPTNWDEFQSWATAMAVYKSGQLKRAGFSYVSTEKELIKGFAEFLWGAGGDFLSPDNKTVTFNDSAGVEALTFWSDLALKYHATAPLFGEGLSGKDTPIYAGTTGMTFGQNATYYFSSSYNVKLGASLIPGKDSGYVSLLEPFTLSIPRGAKNPDAAWEFIRFAMQADQQEAFCLNAMQVPALNAAADSVVIQQNGVIGQFASTLQYAKALPAIGKVSEMGPILTNAIESAMYGHSAPKAALDSAAQQVEALLKA